MSARSLFLDRGPPFFSRMRWPGNAGRSEAGPRPTSGSLLAVSTKALLFFLLFRAPVRIALTHLSSEMDFSGLLFACVQDILLFFAGLSFVRNPLDDFPPSFSEVSLFFPSFFGVFSSSDALIRRPLVPFIEGLQDPYLH